MAVEKLTFEMNAVGNAVPEMKKVQQQLGSVNSSMQRSTDTMRRSTRQAVALSRSNKGMTRGLGMASLQFQDMAVQASMGTDALRIMTMQGPQLASIFGPKGMIFGAIIAIGGALALLGDRTTRMSFDFKKFGADMKTVFQPFIDFIRPAIDLVVKGFHILKRAAMAVLNGLVNGFARFLVIVSNIPSIVAESFRRGSMHINLFKTNALMFFNEIEFSFLLMISNITDKFFEFTNNVAKELNRSFNLELPEDIGKAALSNLESRLDDNVREMTMLGDAAVDLRSALDKPSGSVEALKNELADMIDIDIFSYFKRVSTAGEDAADKIGGKVTTIADMIGTKFGDAFMSLVDGTKKGTDAFKAMASDIIKELYRIFVVKQITNFISGAFMKAFPSIGGIPSANGGGYTGNGARAGGMDGKGGFMAMLHPRETIVDHTKGGQSGGVVINQTINVSTGVQQTVRTEIKTLMPQIAESTKAAVADAVMRGGNYRKAFA